MNFLLRKSLDRSKPNRRDFMVQSTCAGLGITSVVNTLSQLQLVGAAAAAGGPTDFKALICIFQAGGNDSNNLLIPGHSGSSMSSARTHYETGRGVPTYAGGAGGLAVPAAELLATKLTIGSNVAYDPAAGYTGADMALHPACPEMAGLFNNGALAMVANVGTLTATGVTRDNFNDALPTKPPQLFSHADQVLQWQSSISDQPFTSGWGGRIADLLNSSYNSGSGGLAMGVSIAGVNSFQVGLNNQAFVMSTAGSQNLYGYGTGNVGYANALLDTTLKPFISGPTGYDPLTSSNYKPTGEGWRLRALETVMEMNHANLFDGSHGATAKRARTTEGVVTDALAYTNGTGGPTLDSYFTTAFGTATAANNDFANQLKMAARMIIGNYALLQAGKASNTRQTFFLQQSGYDTHASQMAITSANVVNTGVGQYALLSTLSRSVSAFQQAILNHPSGGSALWASITAFSSSDFCRTFTPNKTDSTGGSDHGWGGNAFVVGGAVHGGVIYGTYPLLLVNDGIDCTGSRGRWIPTTSVDQYAAKIAAWFGVPAGSMSTIFPNLGRFGGGTNLSFI